MGREKANLAGFAPLQRELLFPRPPQGPSAKAGRDRAFCWKSPSAFAEGLAGRVLTPLHLRRRGSSRTAGSTTSARKVMARPRGESRDRDSPFPPGNDGCHGLGTFHQFSACLTEQHEVGIHRFEGSRTTDSPPRRFRQLSVDRGAVAEVPSSLSVPHLTEPLAKKRGFPKGVYQISLIPRLRQRLTKECRV